MSRYVGLDVHKQFVEVCILDATGRVAWRGRTGCSRAGRLSGRGTRATWTRQAVLSHTAAAACGRAS